MESTSGVEGHFECKSGLKWTGGQFECKSGVNCKQVVLGPLLFVIYDIQDACLLCLSQYSIYVRRRFQYISSLADSSNLQFNLLVKTYGSINGVKTEH